MRPSIVTLDSDLNVEAELLYFRTSSTLVVRAEWRSALEAIEVFNVESRECEALVRDASVLDVDCGERDERTPKVLG
jgi:hypothetical protein